MADAVEAQEAVAEQQKKKQRRDELRSLLQQRMAPEDAALYESNLDSLVRAGFRTESMIARSNWHELEKIGLPAAQILTLGESFNIPGIPQKRQASPTWNYLDRSFESASDMAKENKYAIKHQHQINDNSDKDETPLEFRDQEPFAANGRCSWRRCPASLVHPAFGEAIANLALPASELQRADWDLYHECAEAMLSSCCLPFLARTFYSTRRDFDRKLARSMVLALCGGVYILSSFCHSSYPRHLAGDGILPQYGSQSAKEDDIAHEQSFIEDETAINHTSETNGWRHSGKLPGVQDHLVHRVWTCPDLQQSKLREQDVQGQRGAWIGSLEFKCMQASAELQMLEYYRIMLRKQHDEEDLILHFSTMPLAALEVVGNELRFALHHALVPALRAAMSFIGMRAEHCSPMCRLGAFWFEETACAARLGCVELRGDADIEECRAGAALLRAFLHLVKGLNTSQAELIAVLDEHASKASVPHMQPLRPMPEPVLLRAGIPHVLVSNDRWTEIEQMVRYRLYSAHDAQLHARVALKLVQHYRPAAHRLWAAHGVAIDLLEEPRALPGGYHLLVMPLLTSDKGWLPGNKVPQARHAAAKAAVKRALDRAHALRDSSGRRYAHGDAKSGNVMLRYDDSSEGAEPAEVRLIDMDWSGEAGADRYLCRPNPMLGQSRSRPEAVKRGLIIEQQHDLDTWDASWSPLYEALTWRAEQAILQPA